MLKKNYENVNNNQVADSFITMIKNLGWWHSQFAGIDATNTNVKPTAAK